MNDDIPWDDDRGWRTFIRILVYGVVGVLLILAIAPVFVWLARVDEEVARRVADRPSGAEVRELRERIRRLEEKR